MKQGRIITDDFTETVRRSLTDTLNFENHSLYEKYDYEEEGRKLGSALNLCLADNYILSALIPWLRKESPVELMSDSDRIIYNKNPMKLSYHRYGTGGYWWIILGVNGYFNPYEFHDFIYLQIPGQAAIASALDRELFNNKNYGVIPA
jgi:hypothetical protein